MPDADNTSEGEAANTDNMAVDAGQETSKAKHRSHSNALLVMARRWAS